MLGDHIQCISEEISFIGFCLTFSAIIGWIIKGYAGPQAYLKVGQYYTFLKDVI